MKKDGQRSAGWRLLPVRGRGSEMVRTAHVFLGHDPCKIRFAHQIQSRHSDTRYARKIGKALPFLGMGKQQHA